MKTVVADFESIIYAVRIVATDGTTLRMVQYPRDLVMGGHVYHTDSGYQFTGLLSSSSLAASMIDNDGIFTDLGIKKIDVLNGKWDGARGYCFATSWKNPTEDEEPIGQFIVGKMQLLDDKYSIELMHLVDALNQPTGVTVSPLCRNTLFDETLDGEVIPPNRSRCQLDIDDYKIMGVAVTAVASRVQFTAAALDQPDDWFGAGWLRWKTGNNSVLRSVGIRDFAAGVITLTEPLPYAIQDGDEFDIIPGCRKRKEPDCLKFDNRINHGGFSRVPPPDAYSKIGGT